MASWRATIDADGMNRILADAFPNSTGLRMVRDVTDGRVLLVIPTIPGMLRPGGLISGPQLMSLADTAAYVLLMAHVGAELMAVTSSLTMHFLRGAKPGDLHAEATLLSLGKRNVVSDVRLWTEGPDRLAAQATGIYARPMAEAA
jgi:uncharacterized protein (TIGR00369 family)